MKALIFLMCILWTATAYCQDTTVVKKMYLSREDFLAQRPIEHELYLIHRQKSDIKMSGGNDFKVMPLPGDTLSKKYISNTIWAVADGDTVYLNSGPVMDSKGYIKAETKGGHVLLSSCITGPKMCKELNLTDLTGKVALAGTLGGGIGGAFAGAKLAQVRVPLIYDLKEGKLESFSQQYVDKCAERFPALQEKYNTSDCSGWELPLITEFVNDRNQMDK